MRRPDPAPRLRRGRLWCNTEAMSLHLAAISAKIAAGGHPALLVDQAGWHLSAGLIVPDNISIVPLLPAKCPELNPQENVWQFMRDNWLSNRVFTCSDNWLDHCCDAWNKLAEQPWIIMSIGLRDWAHRVLIKESWYDPCKRKQNCHCCVQQAQWLRALSQ